MEEQIKKRMQTFAVDVIRLVERLPHSLTNDVIGKQLIRCATSVGANYRAACRARSKPDFISKVGIAEEEADECQYWLEILCTLDRVDVQKADILRKEAYELTAILASSGKTARANR
jgi:four helix bundle protein